jgi:WD40 repeat protein
MTSVDRILIDPGGEELAAALVDAASAVDRDQLSDSRPLPCLEGDAGSLWQEMRDQSEGARFWRVAGPGLYGVRAELVAIWWTDFLGRRHLRLLGGSRHRGMELPAPLPSPHRPPLTCVYPDSCVVATQHRRSRVLAVCDCGAWGPPERLAWMGPHCGPCFDRAAGDPQAAPALLPACGTARSVAFAPDGCRLAVWDQVGEISLWDLDTPHQLERRQSYRPPGKLAFSPDGRYLAWCSPGHDHFRLLDLEEGVEAVRSATAFAFTPTPGHLVLALHSIRLTCLELTPAEPAGATVLSFRLPFPITCRDLAVSPDGSTLAAAAGENGLCLWDMRTGEPLHRDESAACREPLAWSLDGRALACGVAARFWKAMLWDTVAQQRRGVVGGTAPLHALAFSPDGHWLVTCEDNAIRTWHVETGQERRCLTLPGGEHAEALAFSPDGRTAALGTSRGRVRLWPAEALWPDE